MKCIANPVEVDAHVITKVGELDEQGARMISCGGLGTVADAGMLARYTPKPGDYVVVQLDGYLYLNPKEVFERKYSPAPVAFGASTPLQPAAPISNRPPYETFKGATCKGSYALGSACGRCERCVWERKHMAHAADQ